MMKIKVDVTQQDIDTGVKNSCDCCPIARAIARLGFKVKVYNHNLFLDSYKADLPLEAQRFIRIFDSGQEVSPFSFELKLVES